MPIYVASGSLAPGLKVNAVDLSDHVKAIEVQMNTDDVDVTAMGATSKQHAPGLRDDRIIVTFYQDFASSKVDATLNPLQGSSTGATIIAYANGVTASSTAPSYTMIGAPYEYSPINLGGPGEASTTQVTFLPSAGTNTQIVRATA
jgi:hypothetical protein